MQEIMKFLGGNEEGSRTRNSIGQGRVYSGVLNFLGVLLGGTAVAFGIVNLLPVDLLISPLLGFVPAAGLLLEMAVGSHLMGPVSVHRCWVQFRLRIVSAPAATSAVRSGGTRPPRGCRAGGRRRRAPADQRAAST